MAWIEYHTKLRDHWKIQRLADVLGVDYITALGAISCLWLWCAEYAPKGFLGRFTDDEIRFGARISSQKFTLSVLVGCGLVTKNKFIHDWGKHGIKLLESKRKANREYAKRKRSSGYPLDTHSVAIPNQPNHTIPNLTIPNQIKGKFPFLETEDFKNVFNDFLEMRKKIRRTATARAQELILKELHKNNIDTAKAMLNQSIINSWAGVFPIKENYGQYQRGTRSDVRTDRQKELDAIGEAV